MKVEQQMNEIPSNDLVEEWLETHLTPEINTELTQMRDDWEKERQEYLKQDETGHRNLMTDEQIELLRRAIQQEIEVASIDGFEHGAWGWAEKNADATWKSFQESFKPVEIDGIKDEN